MVQKKFSRDLPPPGAWLHDQIDPPISRVCGGNSRNAVDMSNKPPPSSLQLNFYLNWSTRFTPRGGGWYPFPLPLNLYLGGICIE
jgi:hypothetical protein